MNQFSHESRPLRFRMNQFSHESRPLRFKVIQDSSSQPGIWWWVKSYYLDRFGYYNCHAGTIGCNDEGFIHDLFILPDCRRQGVATQLIHECEKLVISPLFFWHRTDTPFGFYEKLGFKKKNGKLIKPRT